MNNSIIWLIIFILTLIIEGLTVGLVSIWFSIGALGAFIATYFTENTIIQLFVFVIISIIALIITRPLTKKYLAKEKTKTNYNDLIGKTGIVIENITDKKMGIVKIKNQTWSAINSTKGTLKKDEEVEVLSIEGVKLIVRKKEN